MCIPNDPVASGRYRRWLVEGPEYHGGRVASVPIGFGFPLKNLIGPIARGKTISLKTRPDPRIGGATPVGDLGLYGTDDASRLVVRKPSAIQRGGAT